jgi:RES domain-containing protein
VRAYRLVKAKYVATVLAGDGASFRYGARWNEPGDRAVYAAENRALAVVESLAHVPGLKGLPSHVMVELEIPGDAIERPADAPPATDAAAARAFGSRWFREARSVALVVPSVVVPEEMNVVINAGHPNAARVSVIAQVDYPLDNRLQALLGKT